MCIAHTIFSISLFLVCLDRVWLLPYCFASYRNCWTNDLITLHSSISSLVLSRVQIVIRFELLTNYIEWNAHPFSQFSFSSSCTAFFLPNVWLKVYSLQMKQTPQNHRQIFCLSLVPSFSFPLVHLLSTSCTIALCSLLPVCLLCWLCISVLFTVFYLSFGFLQEWGGQLLRA